MARSTDYSETIKQVDGGYAICFDRRPFTLGLAIRVEIFNLRTRLNWETYSLRFVQQVADGYRYLDRCGEFICKAMEEGFLSVETKPTGAHLAVPELSMRALIDATQIELMQEMPVDPPEFILKCMVLSHLYSELFGPVSVESNWFEAKMFWRMSSEKEAEGTMLRFRGGAPDEVAAALRMPLVSQQLAVTCVSGSQRVQLSLRPGAFETVRVLRYNSSIGASKSQRMRAQRLSTTADRVGNYPAYAIFLEVSAKESEPALDSEGELFRSFLRHQEKARDFYKVR